ncbi:MAG: tetratricopeptide repeat-containing serine/threonine protein kinase [Phycisphaerales bacterium]|nr:tetratricopeptide repeat protein [Planctomycetota bacterium]MCH8507847.1 tetratricopeptide repeat-containing serine/threonine protein kinase [Phycisphaerales bacterium]
MSEQDRFRRVESIFERAVVLSPPERAGFLDEACGGDAELRASVEALLRADGGSSERLELGPGPIAGEALGAVLWRDPDRVAGYRIVRRLGAGGMGIVYEAEQERPARRVALKLLRAERLTGQGVRRMEFEGEMLGRLSHPGIATVYEAGVWEDGGVTRPFVAMELVEGVAITDYVRAAGLRVPERLALFAQVCDAAHHAHQRGVIHRDLKPANILVDAQGVPKVVDFGIARDAARAGDATVTQTGQLLGTLAYMAPERLSGEAVADARADLYSLGVVLYEILTGRLPHEFTGPEPVSLTDAIRRVTETDALAVGAMDPSLRGDIEVIVGAALARDPARRYASAAALAEDVRRLLSDLPILARRPSTVYQIRKFARRNRGLVAAGVLVAVGLCAGVAGLVVGLGEAVRQRAAAEEQTIEAERHARIAMAINRFVNMDLLGQAARERMGRGVTVKEAVDEAASALDQRFEEELEVRAAIRNSVAGIYDSLSEYEAAESHYLRAIEEFSSALGDDAELTHQARQDLGRMYRRLSRLDEAAAIMGPLYERFRERFGPADERTLRALIDLASVNADRGDFDLGFEMLDRFDADRAGVFGDDSSVVIRALEARGMLNFQLRRFEPAAEAFARVAAFRERDQEHPHGELTPLANLAASYEGLGRYEEAEPIYRRVLEIETRLGGPDNLETLATAHNLAFLLASMGRHEESEPLYRDTLERCARVLGPAHEGTLSCMTALASLLRQTDRREEARTMLEEAWDIATDAYGIGSPMSSHVGSILGLVCGEIGEDARAVEVLTPVIAATEAMLGQDHPRVANLLLGSGRSKWRIGDRTEGRLEIERARAILLAAGGEDSPAVARAENLLNQIDAASDADPDSE